mmetsp:Transcript_48396/g.128166  ORF Transcript_48396/g.128166 Transcript_48396/m.128166 type:complete len:164 (-) Transcript_48396:371-862(-)
MSLARCRFAVTRGLLSVAPGTATPWITQFRQSATSGPKIAQRASVLKLDTASSTSRSEANQPRDSQGEAWEPEDGNLLRKPQSKCPFFVSRTSSQNLPVYVVKRQNRNQAVTVIRKVKGNKEAFIRELEFLCRCKVKIGKSGFLELPGNRRVQVLEYLRSVGY